MKSTPKESKIEIVFLENLKYCYCVYHFKHKRMTLQPHHSVGWRILFRTMSTYHFDECSPVYVCSSLCVWYFLLPQGSIFTITWHDWLVNCRRTMQWLLMLCIYNIISQYLLFYQLLIANYCYLWINHIVHYWVRACPTYNKPDHEDCVWWIIFCCLVTDTIKFYQPLNTAMKENQRNLLSKFSLPFLWRI